MLITKEGGNRYYCTQPHSDSRTVWYRPGIADVFFAMLIVQTICQYIHNLFHFYIVSSISSLNAIVLCTIKVCILHGGDTDPALTSLLWLHTN